MNYSVSTTIPGQTLGGSRSATSGVSQWRRFFVMAFFVLAASGVIGRLVYLQVFAHNQYVVNSKRTYVNSISLPVSRGSITDRNGELLAVTVPTASVSIRLSRYRSATDKTALRPLAKLLEMDLSKLANKLSKTTMSTVNLARDLPQEVGQQVRDLELDYVRVEDKHSRYYPGSEESVQLVGFTDLMGNGQEGMEMSYQELLVGEKGRATVVRDAVRSIMKFTTDKEPKPGRDLPLSIDSRIQYKLYHELKRQFIAHRAVSAASVVVDVHTGEVLAMASLPSVNPNHRPFTQEQMKRGVFRNRAVLDIFEPGSTMKPFTVAAGIETGAIAADGAVDTRPGYIVVDGHTIREEHGSKGVLTLAQVIKKSSNVGAAKIALSMAREDYWEVLSQFGFGRPSGSLFPYEPTGELDSYYRWSKVRQATMSFGYGLQVSVLQLARAYSVLANGGYLLPMSLVKLDESSEQYLEKERIISESTAKAVVRMMEGVVQPGGTAPNAKLPGYRVAGKTGTVRKAANGGYSKRRYMALFAGIAPASDPRYVMITMFNEPRSGEYYGGKIAAPVFAKVMPYVLNLMAIAPDDMVPTGPLLVKGGARVAQL